jgi:ribosomal protein S18 acetylase RimI-like enzyme
MNLAIPSEIDPIMLLIKDAIQKMEREGIHQWDEIYPTKEIFSADIAAGSLFAARMEGVIAGIMALNSEQSQEYNSLFWSDDHCKPLIILRLCVNTTFQGKGIAKKLVQFAEGYARENQYSSIRLDAFINNKISVGLYDSLGYQRKGIVQFRKGEFYCYEKVLLYKNDR